MKNNVIELNVVDSTQQYIRQNIENIEVFDCCFATKQTAGYGRSGNWNSDYQNLYFSKLLPKDKYNFLSAITAAHMLLATFCKDVEIKVPNDLYSRGKKIGGILIENTDDLAILGIGLNINGSLPEFTSLSDLTNQRYRIDELAAKLDELINLNLTMATDMLEQYYKHNCRIIGTNVDYIDLSSNDTFSGTVTDLDSETIAIDGLKFNQMAIKITSKK